MERDWIDYATATGSIATAMTLLYIVIKEWRTRKHITDLAVVAKELKEQNEMQKLRMKYDAQPQLRVRQTYMAPDNNMHVVIENCGPIAFIDNISFLGETTFEECQDSEIPPNKFITLKSDIIGTKNGIDRNYTLILSYSDYHANKYQATVIGSALTVPDIMIAGKRKKVR
jgi:hypothetical protein